VFNFTSKEAHINIFIDILDINAVSIIIKTPLIIPFYLNNAGKVNTPAPIAH